MGSRVGKGETDPGDSSDLGIGFISGFGMESGKGGEEMKALEHDHQFGGITGIDLMPFEYCMACEIEAYRAIGTPEEIKRLVETAKTVCDLYGNSPMGSAMDRLSAAFEKLTQNPES